MKLSIAIVFLSVLLMSGCSLHPPGCSIEASGEWQLIDRTIDLSLIDIATDSRRSIAEHFEDRPLNLYARGENEYYFCAPPQGDFGHCGELSAIARRIDGKYIVDTLGVTVC